MTLGARLRGMRKVAKESQIGLSIKTGIPQTTISDWENDKSEPTASDIVKLATALGVTITELLGESDGHVA